MCFESFNGRKSEQNTFLKFFAFVTCAKNILAPMKRNESHIQK